MVKQRTRAELSDQRATLRTATRVKQFQDLCTNGGRVRGMVTVAPR